MKLEETKKNAVSEPEKKKDNNSKGKKESGFSFSSWVDVHKAEFKRIVWPSKQEVAKETVIVLLLCFVLGAIIFGMDELLTMGYDALIKLAANV